MQTQKDTKRVALYIDDWRIEGDLFILAESRLTDALNSKAKDFIVIGNAKITDARSGEFIAEADYLDVNRIQITLVYEL